MCDHASLAINRLVYSDEHGILIVNQELWEQRRFWGSASINAQIVQACILIPHSTGLTAFSLQLKQPEPLSYNYMLLITLPICYIFSLS